MSERPPLSARIEAWTREAFETWGDDWSRISAHIERRMSALQMNERRNLSREAELTLVGAEEGAKH